MPFLGVIGVFGWVLDAGLWAAWREVEVGAACRELFDAAILSFLGSQTRVNRIMLQGCGQLGVRLRLVAACRELLDAGSPVISYQLSSHLSLLHGTRIGT